MKDSTPETEETSQVKVVDAMLHAGATIDEIAELTGFEQAAIEARQQILLFSTK